MQKIFKNVCMSLNIWIVNVNRFMGTPKNPNFCVTLKSQQNAHLHLVNSAFVILKSLELGVFYQCPLLSQGFLCICV